MAEKYRPSNNNCKPPSKTDKTKDLTYNDPDVNPTVSGIIKNVWNEVGDGTHSSFSGVDSYGQPLKAITFGKRCENMYRYEIIGTSTNDDWVDEDDIDATDSGLQIAYIYEQGRKNRQKGNKAIPKWEYYCRPDYTYEEGYFQHIFNWPTSHSTVERKIGGAIKETITTTVTTEESSETTVTYASHTPSFTYESQSLTLEKTVSKIYYIDDDWNYQEIIFNSNGTISSSVAKERIGEPIIYHGGTDDKTKLFFNYDVSKATKDVIAIGDQVNGIEVTNVVNYVTYIGLRRTVSSHAKKRVEDKLSSTNTNTKSWIKVNSVADLEVDDEVSGSGIAPNTKIVEIDAANFIVYLSKTLRSKKIKTILFTSESINRVDKNTLCYATLASDAEFAADGVYSVTRNGVSTGINIIARAGVGIVNRSAIVGIYNSTDKKEVEYEPVFYSSDNKCEPIKLEDENGEYTLGTIIYGDGSKDEEVYLLNEPKTTIGYQIASMYVAATNGPIDKDNLEKWLAEYNRLDVNNRSSTSLKISIDPILKIYSDINAYVISTLNNKKVAGAIDVVCGNPIQLDYVKSYVPFVEMDNINENVSSFTSAVQDICITTQPFNNQDYSTVDAVKDRFNQIIQDSVRQSSFLSEDYYNRLVGNEDSLVNRINTAVDISISASPTNTKINNLPPQLEGQDSSGRRFTSKSYRNLPPAMDRVKYFVSDLLIATDSELNATLDLDPSTTINQPKIIISSIPVWQGGAEDSETITIKSIPAGTGGGSGGEPGGAGGNVTVTFNVNKTTNSYGGLEELTTSYSGPTPASVTVVSGDTTTTYSFAWLNPSGDRIYKDHKQSFGNGGYIDGVSWHVHPDLRDLDNKNWPKDDDETDENDHLNPITLPVHPKTIWKPNINYQRDYHKLFWFRSQEVIELIGETILNNGNPYMDSPVTAKIVKTIGESDTTIKVDSTDDFMSSGYLIIPKYTKKLFTTETANVDGEFTYSGEEIIYYGSKTKTSFNDCERNLFQGTSYPEIIPVSAIEVDTRYQIHVLGDTDWQSIGAPADAQVGTVFVATKEADSTGTIELQMIFEWNDNPSVAGTALGTVSWSSTGFSFTQSDQSGRDKKKDELTSGTYLINVQNNSGGFVVENNKKICFFDNDGNDCNATIKLNIKNKWGQDIDAYFNESGHLIITGGGSGAGTGQVIVFGTTSEEVPDPEYIKGVEKPPTLPLITSYDPGQSISQHLIFRVKE